MCILECNTSEILKTCMVQHFAEGKMAIFTSNCKSISSLVVDTIRIISELKNSLHCLISISSQHCIHSFCSSPLKNCIKFLNFITDMKDERMHVTCPFAFL